MWLGIIRIGPSRVEHWAAGRKAVSIHCSKVEAQGQKSMILVGIRDPCEVEKGVIDNAGVSKGKRLLLLMYIDAPEAGRHMTILISVALLLGQTPRSRIHSRNRNCERSLPCNASIGRRISLNSIEMNDYLKHRLPSDHKTSRKRRP